ncbi:hypothetical protein PSCT_00584 [Pseudomonas sp. SCT]|nr:hypothetical protein PSCT_00584 [Pseudomonas sp. SCT]
MRRVRFALSCGSVGASVLTDGACARDDWFGWFQTAAFSPALDMARPNNGLLALAWESRANMRAGQCIGFALLGESLFPNAEKVTKNACPSIRGSLRPTSLTPSPLRGSAHKGHPWPFIAGTPSPLAAFMPLAPLRADSIRPAERGDWRCLLGRASKSDVGWKTAQHFPPQATSKPLPRHGRLLFKTVGKLRVTHPTDFASLRAPRQHALRINPKAVTPPSRGEHP